MQRRAEVDYVNTPLLHQRKRDLRNEPVKLITTTLFQVVGAKLDHSFHSSPPLMRQLAALCESASNDPTLSMLQTIQLLHVHRFKRTVDVIDEDLHRQKAHQHVEKDTEFYDQRNTVRPEHGKQSNAVFKDEETDDLSQRLPSRYYDEQSDEDQAHGER